MKNNNEKPLGIANWLTITRLILMIPFIAFMIAIFAMKFINKTSFYYEGTTLKGDYNPKTMAILYWINVVIFIVAMITDFVDGFVARKTKTVTEFGKIFDPIADKVATNLMIAFLAMLDYTFLVILILFIIRDILVDGTRVYATKNNVKVAANIWGKIKTLIVSFAIIFLAFASPWLVNQTNETKKLLIFYLNIPLIAGLFLAWISGIIYMKNYLKGIRNN
ncbi:CDP-diacylglycerol--glycerol-3-phosphate 3-phosphatidyltransferase [Metamycoplasma buccale]|uniref:CDP-diacylglycerol--glycerol-3-phosphate 3-phosphatidyltransferase n=1 Tax=Metamycoplasma buccale TaxID=55602 RepID=UPI00398EC056